MARLRSRLIFLSLYNVFPGPRFTCFFFFAVSVLAFISLLPTCPEPAMFGQSLSFLCNAVLVFSSLAAGKPVSSSVSPGRPPAPEVVKAINTTYFEFETLQLTDDGLAGLDDKTAALFQFGDETGATKRGVSGSCKVFPGDNMWPSTWIWSALKLVLGHDALIKTVPLASPCYAGEHYDRTTCENMYTNWQDSRIQ